MLYYSFSLHLHHFLTSSTKMRKCRSRFFPSANANIPSFTYSFTRGLILYSRLFSQLSLYWMQGNNYDLSSNRSISMSPLLYFTINSFTCVKRFEATSAISPVLGFHHIFIGLHCLEHKTATQGIVERARASVSSVSSCPGYTDLPERQKTRRKYVKMAVRPWMLSITLAFVFLYQTYQFAKISLIHCHG